MGICEMSLKYQVVSFGPKMPCYQWYEGVRLTICFTSLQLQPV